MLLVKRTCLRVSKALLAVVSSFCQVVRVGFFPNKDRASPVTTIHEGRAACNLKQAARPSCMVKTLSRLFSLWLVLVGSLYLLHIARGYVVVGAAHEIYGS